MASQVADIFEGLGLFIERRTGVVLLSIVLLVFGSFFAAQEIEMATGLDTFVERDSQLFQDFETYYENFLEGGTIMVLVISEDVTDVKVLRAIERFEEQLEGREYISGSSSLVTLLKDVNQLMTGEAVIPNNKADVKAILNTMPEDVVKGIMPDDHNTVVAVQLPSDISFEDSVTALDTTKNAVSWAEFPPGTEVIVTGDAAFDISMNDEMGRSLGMMLMVAFMLMVVALYMVFNVRWRLLPFLMVGIGIILTFGAMGVTKVPLTMTSMAVFPILIGLGIDYAIQFHNRMEEELGKGETTEEAIVQTVKHMGPAVGIAFIATSLGFVALFISPVPMVRDFGMMTFMGLVICYIVAMTLGVALLFLLDKRAEEKGNRNHRKRENEDGDLIGNAVGKLAVFMSSNPVIVIFIASTLLITGLYFDQKVGVQTDIMEFVPPDMPALLDFRHFEVLYDRSDQLNIIVKADDVTSPEVLNWMNDFGEHEINGRKNVISASSIATEIMRMNGDKIPNDPTKIASTMEMIPDQIKNRYVVGNNIAVLNLEISSVTGLGTERTRLLILDVEDDIEWFGSPIGLEATATGGPVLMASIFGALTSGRFELTMVGLLAIFLALFAIYRDWMKAFIPITPILMVVGWSGGVMYAMGIKYNPLTATLGALIIGIGCEYTILLMGRYFEERDNGMEPTEALEVSSSRIGKAIVASGLTTVFGFSALIASPFPMNSDFGLVTVINVGFAILSALIVLPPILITLDNWRSKRRIELLQ
ncbi:MAG: RND family transporter [Halobacteriota archaeon]|nr:RND family transporter [Halobacteriota archaeon]